MQVNKESRLYNHSRVLMASKFLI